MSRLVDPRMMQMLQRDFLPDACRIERNTPIRDTAGEPIESWAAVAGWETLPCRKAPLSANEQRTGNQVYLEATEKIILAGMYPGLDETMRAVVNGQAYDIQGVEPDSESVNTTLMVRIAR